MLNPWWALASSAPFIFFCFHQRKGTELGETSQPGHLVSFEFGILRTDPQSCPGISTAPFRGRADLLVLSFSPIVLTFQGDTLSKCPWLTGNQDETDGLGSALFFPSKSFLPSASALSLLLSFIEAMAFFGWQSILWFFTITSNISLVSAWPPMELAH